MRKLTGAFLGAAATAFLIANTVFAETIVHQFNFPVTFATVNNCNGDEVVITGNNDVLLAITISSSGNFLIKQHAATKGQGETLDGARYVYSDEFDDEFVGAGATTHTQVLVHLLTSMGPEPNAYLKMLLHTTINANGAPTAVTMDNPEMIVDCRG
jgi:hypothetical protein